MGAKDKRILQKHLPVQDKTYQRAYMQEKIRQRSNVLLEY